MSDEQVQEVVPTPPVEQPDGGVLDAGLVDGGGQSDVPADPAPVADPVAEVVPEVVEQPPVQEPAPVVAEVAPPSPAFEAAMAWINELAADAPPPSQITFYQLLLNNVSGLQNALAGFK